MKTADSQNQQTIHLRVVSQANKAPVADAALTVMFGGLWERGEIHSQTTDADGRCRIELPELQPDVVRAFIRKAGFCGWVVRWLKDRTYGGFPAAVTVELPAGSSLGGVVMNEEGYPVAGVAVDLSPRTERSEPSARPRDPLLGTITSDTATTDSEGRWQSDIMPAELALLSVRLTHSDYVRERLEFDAGKPNFKTFQELKSAITIRQGIKLEGKVLDGRGNPLINAEVAQGARNRADTVVVRTDANGRFTFPFQFKPGPTPLCVQVFGYAPAAKMVEVKAGMGPVEFTLQPGQVLRGRVTDREGHPICGVRVMYDRPHRAPLQLHHYVGFDTTTDALGRFVWDGAPEGEVSLTFFARGYLTIRSQSLESGPEEQQVVMGPAWRISGRVGDAQSGKPIPQFRIVPGAIGPGALPHQQKEGAPRWSWEFAQFFNEGCYEMVFSDPVPLGRTGPLDCVLRIDAEGYRSVVSKLYKWEEGDAVWNVELNKAKQIVGRVNSADGLSLSNATIVVQVGTGIMRFVNGRLVEDRWLEYSVAHTDSQGIYSVQQEEPDCPVYIIHEAGFLETTVQQLEISPQVELLPWGTVEGTYRIGSKPAVEQRVNLTIQRSRRAVFSNEATTDAAGNLRFERVVPGQVSLALWMEEGGQSKALRPISDPVEVKAGETVWIEVGGQGRVVTGRLVAPGIEGDIDWSVGHLALSQVCRTGAPQPPAGLTRRQRQQWSAEWFQSEAYQKLRKEAPFTQKFVKVKLAKDGTFRAEDVSPGDYQFHYTLHRSAPPRSGGSNASSLVSHSHHVVNANPVTVPAAIEGQIEPLDLGTIPFTPPIEPALGQMVQELEMTSLEGKSVKLTDYRGKYVALAFWQADTIDHWGQKYEEFNRLNLLDEARDRLALMCIGTDASLADAQEMFAEGKVPAWYGWHGPDHNSRLIRDYGYDCLSSFYLVDPVGRLLSRGYEAAAIRMAFLEDVSR